MLQPRETSSVNSDQFDRAGWWLGIIAPILILVGFFAVDEGGTELSGSTTEIVEHLDALHGRIVIGSMIGILGAFALLGFVASLRLHLSKTGARGEWLGLVAFGSGMIMAAGAIVQGSFRLEIDAIVDSGIQPDGMLPIWELGTVIDILVWGSAGLVATMCISAFTNGLLPKPLAAVGALLVAATIALTPTDHGGVSLTLLLWLSTASGFLVARSARPTLA
ncbi:MAG: hypothetical protein OEW83_19160 [Acidimicrobiia bacterium]|nr:hypothetical protein [Acidimicrobiia bacterium]